MVTRNDLLYKIIFAIEIALIPLVMFAHVMSAFPNWSMGIFVGGILICRVWREILSNKEDKTHTIINAIGSALSISVLAIFFACIDLVPVALAVFVAIFTVLGNVMKVVLYGKHLPETIDAVDYCNMLFECAALAVMTFLVFNSMLTNIALFAVVLTAAVSVAYKIYFTVRFTNVISNIKAFFANLFRRK